MSLFFFRPWAGVDDKGPGGVTPYLTPADPIYYTRWGYVALLGVTMGLGILLNLVYLAGYHACPRAMLEVPHVAIVSLALRDLLICVLVIPAALDWLIAGLTSWPGGEAWCSTAVFLDYYLMTLHPLLILALCVILYTRKLPPKLTPPSPAPPPMMNSSRSARSGYTQRTGYTARTHPSHRAPSVSGSVASGSVQGGRHDGTFRKGFAKKEGSVNGSYAGSVTGYNNTPTRKVSHMSNTSSHRGSRPGGPHRTSSPLGQVAEERYAESVDGELWELASMEYPGKQDGDLDLDFEDDDDYAPDEPRLREWLKWVVMSLWLVALGIGVPAMQQAQYGPLPPGCYLAQDNKLIARSRFNYVIQDPTVNLLISSVIINYILPGVAMILCSVLLCTLRWTQDGKLNRFFKMTIGLCVMFLAARSPVDILQFRDIIHSSQGVTVTNLRPDQLEHEVLLFWAAVMPVVGNPVIYLFCVTEYRQNILAVWRSCTQGEKKDEYNDDQFLDIPREEEQYSVKDLQQHQHTIESDVL